MYFVMCMYFAAFTIICVVISALSVSSAMGKFRKEGLTKHSLRPTLDWRKCIVFGKFRQYIFPFTDRTRTCYEIRQKQENIVRDLPENPRLLAFGHACFAHLAKALKSQQTKRSWSLPLCGRFAWSLTLVEKIAIKLASCMKFSNCVYTAFKLFRHAHLYSCNQACAEIVTRYR